MITNQKGRKGVGNEWHHVTVDVIGVTVKSMNVGLDLPVQTTIQFMLLERLIYGRGERRERVPQQNRGSQILAGAFPVHEEEDFILLDRATHVGAKLFPAEEKIGWRNPRGQVVPAAVIESFSVITIGARTRGNVHRA